ncbi:zinc dependent phospholipase C family protein [Desulfonatronum thiodismutans]|uniref:zinc dependent phospholipase C family protein n=1 Tax=Desulfonatronum thiodismutans TaxID=159290 RepID=UPI0004ABD70B|nr:zinc dependent phospholipase C family protein [Desulfonatronum thiodismutans]
MPKENTHLWFARRLWKQTRNPSKNAVDDHFSTDLIQAHPLFFSLGSIIPDAFFYHPLSRGRRMALVLHGSDPRTRTESFGRMAAWAREEESGRDKAFVLGYLSHVALDRVMHPVVDALSGKRPGQASTGQSTALHRLVETALDQQINRCCRYPRIIWPYPAKRVSVLHRLAGEVGLRRGDVHAALSVQLLVNRLVQGRAAHALVRALHHPSVLDLSVLLNLCYAQLDREPDFFSEKRTGRAEFWRNFHAVNWSRLFERADLEAWRLFDLCTEYWANRLDGSGLRRGLPHKPCD